MLRPSLSGRKALWRYCLPGADIRSFVLRILRQRQAVAKPSEEPAMAQTPSAYDSHLDRSPANYAPLTPLGFIARSAAVSPDRPAVIHGKRRYSWAESYARCRRLASALRQRGIGKNDT